jgi:hypothetical protein
MNTLRLLERIERRVSALPFDCDIIRIDMSLSWDAAVITLCREGHHPEGHDYSTHYYAGCNDGLHWGHYDMPYHVAMSDHTDRVMREWG